MRQPVGISEQKIQDEACSECCSVRLTNICISKHPIDLIHIQILSQRIRQLIVLLLLEVSDNPQNAPSAI